MAENYAVEKEWVTKAGLRASAVRTQLGHLCGYVGVGKKSPLYGKNYSEDLACLSKMYKKAMKGPAGKRGAITILCAASGNKAMDITFNVHGSVTYSRAGKNGFPSEEYKNLWWIGFDCGHCDDNPIKCNLDYVTAECESLAEQIQQVK
jgi:hypothetical protein